MRIPALLAAFVLTAATFPATAEQNLSRQDRAFIEEAGTTGIAEVQLGRLASEQGQNEGVRTFGEHMVFDHSQANQKLSEIAKRAGSPPTKEPPASAQRKAMKLRDLNGAEFDRAYIAAMIEDHKKAIKTFTEQAEDGDNPELKDFARQSLPKLQQHRDMAQNIQAELQGQQAQLPR